MENQEGVKFLMILRIPLYTGGVGVARGIVDGDLYLAFVATPSAQLRGCVLAVGSDMPSCGGGSVLSILC